LTPVAIRAGRICAERLFNGREGLKMNYANIPTIIFSHPPIGTVGLSEKDALAKYGAERVEVFNSQFTNMYYSPAATPDKKLSSLFKLVCLKIGDVEKDKGNAHLRVIGAHGIGKSIDEQMQAISVAINMGATKQDFENSVAIHPTSSEEWVLFDPKYVNWEYNPEK
jgi:glutathione reductase (NADPH)